MPMPTDVPIGDLQYWYEFAQSGNMPLDHLPGTGLTQTTAFPEVVPINTGVYNGGIAITLAKLTDGATSRQPFAVSFTVSDVSACTSPQYRIYKTTGHTPPQDYFSTSSTATAGETVTKTIAGVGFDRVVKIQFKCSQMTITKLAIRSGAAPANQLVTIFDISALSSSSTP